MQGMHLIKGKPIHAKKKWGHIMQSGWMEGRCGNVDNKLSPYTLLPC